MSDLDISVELNEARLQSTLDFIMLGTGTPTLSIYATTKPSPGDAAGGAALVEIPIGGGSVSSNQLHLIPENLTDMVMNSGGALWGRMLNGNGEWVLDATCGATGSGKPIILSDTTLFAGGSVALVSAVFG